MRVFAFAFAFALALCSLASGAAHRSSAAKNAFIKATACPSTGLHSFYRTVKGKKVYVGCPTYVVDHKYPLCAGGRDTPENMQWEQIYESLSKDAAEKHLCSEWTKHGKSGLDAGCYFWGGHLICK